MVVYKTGVEVGVEVRFGFKNLHVRLVVPARVAQLVEHSPFKRKCMGSSPIPGIQKRLPDPLADLSRKKEGPYRFTGRTFLLFSFLDQPYLVGF